MSRTIVRPGHRGMGVSRGLVELGFAYASRIGPVVVIGGCVPAHLPLYAKFGCRKLPNTDLRLSESVGQLGNTVIGRTDVLPQPTQGHVEELRRSMESGATECTLELGQDSHALYRFASSYRARRRTAQWWSHVVGAGAEWPEISDISSSGSRWKRRSCRQYTALSPGHSPHHNTLIANDAHEARACTACTSAA